MLHWWKVVTWLHPGVGRTCKMSPWLGNQAPAIPYCGKGAGIFGGQLVNFATLAKDGTPDSRFENYTRKRWELLPKGMWDLWGVLGSSGVSGKEPTCQCRRHKRCGFDPWVGKIRWRRKWQPTPVFLPGKFHGQRKLVGYNPWGHKESDMTERLNTHTREISSQSVFQGHGDNGKEGGGFVKTSVRPSPYHPHLCPSFEWDNTLRCPTLTPNRHPTEDSLRESLLTS